MKKLFAICCLLFAICCLGCKFDTNTTTNDYDDSELRTRISELERILTEKENQESNTSGGNEENVPENEDNFRIIADGDYFNIINQNGDILYFFSKSDGYSGYCTKREHYIRVTVSVLDMYSNGVYRNYDIWYTKDEYRNKYILYENNNVNFNRRYLFCLKHNKSYLYSGSYISVPSSSTDICELSGNYGFKLESNLAKTPEEFLKNAGLRNQEHLINYILNFIENDE